MDEEAEWRTRFAAANNRDEAFDLVKPLGYAALKANRPDWLWIIAESPYLDVERVGLIYLGYRGDAQALDRLSAKWKELDPADPKIELIAATVALCNLNDPAARELLMKLISLRDLFVDRGILGCTRVCTRFENVETIEELVAILRQDEIG